MPLLQSSPRRRQQTFTVSLNPQLGDNLRQYMRYAKANADDVVGFALNRLFEQDKDFGPWSKDNPAPAPRWRAENGNGNGTGNGHAEDEAEEATA